VARPWSRRPGIAPGPRGRAVTPPDRPLAAAMTRILAKALA